MNPVPSELELAREVKKARDLIAKIPDETDPEAREAYRKRALAILRAARQKYTGVAEA